MSESAIRYARTVDGVNIAYQVRGEGPVDLVYTLGMAGNFEIEFEAPWGTRFSRAARGTSRGSSCSTSAGRASPTGFSARPTSTCGRMTFAPSWTRAGSERAVLVGNRGGGSLAAFFAAMHPDRVLALVLYNSWARTAWAPDYPVGTSKDDLAAWRSEIAEQLGDDQTGETVPPERRARPVRTTRMDPVGSEISSTRSVARRGARVRRVRAGDRRPERPARPCRRLPSSCRAPRPRERGPPISLRGSRVRGTFTCPARIGCPTRGDVDELLGEVERFVRSVHAEEATFERVLTTVAVHRHRRLDGDGGATRRSARGRASSSGTTRPFAP